MGHVLVVDDEPDVRFMLRLIFEGGGYEVTEAVNGADALASVKVATPDLIVSDLSMPVRAVRLL